MRLLALGSFAAAAYSRINALPFLLMWMRSHIGVPVGEKCLLPATVCADEYLSLFSAGAVRRLN
jgi:hypothetical protein